jgi:hypothetical protein
MRWSDAFGRLDIAGSIYPDFLNVGEEISALRETVGHSKVEQIAEELGNGFERDIQR